MSITYQIQPSNLAPSGVTVPYGRYNVILGDSTNVILSAKVEDIVALLKDGNTVTLVDSEGVSVGQIMPSLSGGFTLSESPSPISANVGIGFRPYKQLLAGVRYDVSFSRIDTTYRQPVITSVTSWYQNESYNGYAVNGGHSALIVIEGSNLKLYDTFHIDLLVGVVNNPNVCTNSVYVTWTDKRIEYLEKLAVVAVEATGTLSYYNGDRSIELEIPIVDMT